MLSDLFELLQEVETDMALFFRLLAALPVESAADTADDSALVEPLRRAFYTDEAFAPAQRSRWGAGCAVTSREYGGSKAARPRRNASSA